MKNERGITLVSLMVYIVAMAMVILTVTNITRYFYNNVMYTESTTEYAEDYLKFMVYISEEINESDNTILDITNDTDTGLEKYVIFSKTRNQYTFKGNAIYKNQKKICENVESCEFTSSEDKNQLTIEIKMKDMVEPHTTTYTIRTY